MPDSWILTAIIISGALGYLAVAFVVLTHRPPPSVTTVRQFIELFAQLSDEDREAELAILRERVKARKQ